MSGGQEMLTGVIGTMLESAFAARELTEVRPAGPIRD